MSYGECNAKDLAPHLVGLTFTGEVIIEDDGEYEWQKLVLIDKGGKRFLMEPSRDPEGNGPGFLFFGEEEVKPAPKPKPKPKKKGKKK